jgi:hypothetical protein
LDLAGGEISWNRIKGALGSGSELLRVEVDSGVRDLAATDGSVKTRAPDRHPLSPAQGQIRWA